MRPSGSASTTRRCSAGSARSRTRSGRPCSSATAPAMRSPPPARRWWRWPAASTTTSPPSPASSPAASFTPAGELRVTTSDTLLIHLLTPMFARFPRALPGRAARHGRRQPGAQPVAARCRRRDPRHRPSARDAGRPARGAHRLGALWPGRDFPSRSRGPTPLLQRQWVALGDNLATCRWRASCASTSRAERIVYKVNTVLGLAEAVEAGIGIGHLPCFIADAAPGPDPSGAARPGIRRRSVAADPSRPAPLAARAGVPRFHLRPDRPAPQADRGRTRPSGAAVTIPLRAGSHRPCPGPAVCLAVPAIGCRAGASRRGARAQDQQAGGHDQRDHRGEAEAPGDGEAELLPPVGRWPAHRDAAVDQVDIDLEHQRDQAEHAVEGGEQDRADALGAVRSTASSGPMPRPRSSL